MVDSDDKPMLSRRKALARLGLVAVVVYSAPTITRIDGDALSRHSKGGSPSNCLTKSCSGNSNSDGNSVGNSD
jgi:hypothetical protein